MTSIRPYQHASRGQAVLRRPPLETWSADRRRPIRPLHRSNPKIVLIVSIGNQWAKVKPLPHVFIVQRLTIAFDEKGVAGNSMTCSPACSLKIVMPTGIQFRPSPPIADHFKNCKGF
jgi:hypothetical protein